MKKLLTILFSAVTALNGWSQLNNEWIDYSKTYYKFTIGKDGIYRISKTDLNTIGIGNIPAEQFQLWRNGVEIPLFTSTASGPLANDGFIEFIGRMNDGRTDRSLYLQPTFQLSDRLSLFTDTAAYFLTVNPDGVNARFFSINNNLIAPLPAPLPYFLHTVRHDYKRKGGGYYVNKGFAVNFGEYVYSSSFDAGEMLSSEDIYPGAQNADKSAVFDNLFPATVVGVNPRLRVSWASSAAIPGVSSRDVTASIGNSNVITRRINNFQAFRDSNVALPISLLSGASTTVTISNLGNNPNDRVVAGFCEIEYPRLPNAGGSSFFETAIAAGSGDVLIELTNFNHGGTAPVLYNLTLGTRITGEVNSSGLVRFRLPASQVRQQIVITAQTVSSFQPINRFERKNFINYATSNQAGDYLIISNKRLMVGNTLEEYRAYRSSAIGGAFNAKIVDIEEITDQFAFGIKMHPLSIKNFLRFARTRFAAAPKFCFLVGKGVTYDEFRTNESNPLANQLQLVPTFGYPGSDNLLASNDLTALPATPIGRLSVVNTAEIKAYLDKVKEYEAAQANPSVAQSDKSWMKNVVHVVGANDANTELQIRPYMNEYQRVIRDTLFGATVTTFNKFNSTTASTIENVLLSNLFQSGISLLTYFGHSSATALDYNLDDPNQYNNPGKYPMFMLNGCNAGNFFTFETQRPNLQSTISERYVLAQNRGAIGLVASTHFGLVTGLGIYTRGFYRSLGIQAYNESIGKHIQNAIQFVFTSWGNDFQARFHTEQQTLHGDPAIKLNSFTKPDYSVEQQNIQIEPSFVSIAETKFNSKIYFYNIGKAINDSIVVEVSRKYPQSVINPNGLTEVVYREKRKAPLFIDSLSLVFPINAERDKGNNLITINLDAGNKVDELSEFNNSLSQQVVIFENELRPVSPVNFAIVNQADVKLIASTANPFSLPLNYAFEMDTTDLFNSPAKVSRTINARGGVVEIDPGVSLVNNRVYYWRLGLQNQGGGAPQRWNHASFIYLSGTETGFNQSHFFQHTQSVANRMQIDAATRNWRFASSLNNLFVTHSIFPTSGTEDNHFSLSTNNIMRSTSACVGHSLIFNVFDALTFRPIRVNGTWNSGFCNPNKNPFNYEWDDRNSANRKQMMDFMDSIPQGAFVVVRKILDRPYENETFADNMKADEAIYGSGNSLYHKLKAAGFATIDSFNRPRTFIFTYKKQSTPAFAEVKMSEGLFDRIQLNLNMPTVDTFGRVTSPILGPARSWKTAQWMGSATDEGSGDRVRIKVIGIAQNGVETQLFNALNTQSEIDLTSVSAQQYPYLKLEMDNTDSVRGTPWNLNYWRVYYTTVPEGALAPNLLFQATDTLVQGQPYDLKIAFKNISRQNFDSLRVKMQVTNSNNVTTTTQIKRKPLIAGDTLIISYPLDTRQLQGLNTVYVAANPDNDQPEQHFFNNFLFSKFFVKEDLVNPLLDVTFDGVYILNKDIVSARPHIQIKLKDENSFALLNDTAGVAVKLKFPGENNYRTYKWNTDTLRFTPAASGSNNTATIDFYPVLSKDSETAEYELFVSGKDRNDNRAGRKDYQVSFKVFNKPMISNLLNYPNPFSTSTAFVFTITGSEVPQEFKIQILTVTGKIVKEITKAELGPLRIGNNITEYKWDGTDMFGQRLANGVYLYRVITSLDGNKMEQFRLNDGYNQNTMDVTDQFFKNGYGKMVILR